MRFLLDMNLAPRWCEVFVERGYEARHWSDVGPHDAPDGELMNWARDNEHVILTHDLDFGALLALTYLDGPSVIQIRTIEPLPETVGTRLFQAIDQHQDELKRGALLTIDAARARVRVLPIARSG
ncbi:MAG: DUF5615 family PIN-like protein [Planctomycetota bacterium]|jgi:predicted nuclease of predicted toxin-antitoxin system